PDTVRQADPCDHCGDGEENPVTLHDSLISSQISAETRSVFAFGLPLAEHPAERIAYSPEIVRTESRRPQFPLAEAGSDRAGRKRVHRVRPHNTRSAELSILRKCRPEYANSRRGRSRGERTH